MSNNNHAIVMKKINIILGSALFAACSIFTACHEDDMMNAGKGKVLISASVNSDVKVVSRAASQEELAEKCLVYISNSRGLVRRYKGLSTLPASGIDLKCDKYVAEAWTGDSVSASFDTKWYKGREEFTITNGETTKVDLVCKIANVVASVKYDDAVDNVLKDYSVTVGHAKGSLEFVGKDERKGYYMMPSVDKNLSWTLTGKDFAGNDFTRSGVIENAKAATEYVLHVTHDGTSEDIGGAYLTVVVEEKTIDVEDNVVIELSPSIEGYNFDIDSPIMGEGGSIGRKSVWVSSTAALSSFVIESDILSKFGGLSGDDVELIGASDALVSQLKNGGITFTYTYDDEADVSGLKVNFEEELMNEITNGEYTIKLTATDAHSPAKVSTKTISVNVSDAAIVPVTVPALDVYATSATLTARVVSDVTNPVIMYRSTASRAGDWINAETTRSGDVLTAVLTDLTPGTKYEYTVGADDFTSTDVRSFTTESAQQFENNSFESWSQPSKPYLLYNASNGESMYWDSGNHGSTTLSASSNCTTPYTDLVHSGTYSARLASRAVVGVLASGSAFTGAYLGTDGTNGILGWGRPFTSRPKALKVWLRYKPGTVDKTNSNAPDVVKGNLDKGKVYFGLVDDSKLQGDSSYPDWPIVIRTKTSKFFDKTSADVIAYGEMVFDSDTGDDLIEFTIPFEYLRTDAKPSYIFCTFTASKDGDYFAGSTSSEMIIDDVTLVY